MQADSRETGSTSAPATPGRPSPHLGNSRGDFVGHYKLLDLIGEGGFGVVWLAERREPFVQRVALKVIKPGMDSRAVLARFDQERQALAVMDHPNVARVLDGGLTSTEQGSRPYFVMEFVKGEPITEYCDRNRLSIRERLALFIPVCNAVQHAHHKGIIHRDIKPTNVLVTVLEERLAAKVIDFGVAKAVSHTLTQHTILTEHGQLIGTPEYMSPEQAEMGGTDVDTRTDVYSLGVLLYELLAGSLPFDGAALRSAAFDEIRRIIREQEPPKPSTRLTTLDAAKAIDVAARRQAHREDLARTLRRELDWIPLKAMRKDRSRRYATPGDLAEDVQRYLDGRPVDAAPESSGYLLRKFIARNKGSLAAAAVVVLALSVALAVSTVSARRALASAADARRQTRIAETALEDAEKAREEVVRQTQRAERIARLMDLLGKAQTEFAEYASDESDSFAAYDQLVGELKEGVLAEEPATELTILRVLAQSNSDGDLYDEAAELLARCVEIARATYGDHPITLLQLQLLGAAHMNYRDGETASAVYEQHLALTRRLFPADHLEVASSLTQLADAMYDLVRLDEADRLYSEAVRIYAAHLPDQADQLREALRWQAEGRRAAGRPFSEVLPLLYRWADLARERADTALLNFLVWAAAEQQSAGDLAGAIATRHLILKQTDVQLDAEAHRTGDAMLSLAESHAAAGEFAGGKPFLVRGVELIRASPHTPRAPDDLKKRAAERAAAFFAAWSLVKSDASIIAETETWRRTADSTVWGEAQPTEDALARAKAETAIGACADRSADEASVAAALALAREGTVLSPDNLDAMKALGLAQFRAGLFAESLATLRERENRRSKNGEGSSPLNVGYITLSLASLGRAAEAEEAFAQFEKLMANQIWQGNADMVWVAPEVREAMGRSPSAGTDAGQK